MTRGKKISNLVTAILIVYALLRILDFVFPIIAPYAVIEFNEIKVTGIFPKNEKVEVSSVPFPIGFDFELESKINVESCSLIINNTVVKTIPGLSPGINTIQYGLRLGIFRWKVSCKDIEGSTAISSENTIEIYSKGEVVIKEPEKEEEEEETPLLIEIKNPYQFFIIITLIILIILTTYIIFTSQRFKTMLEERRKLAARERLRMKLQELELQKMFDSRKLEG